MKLLLIITIIVTLIQVVRVSTFFLRKDVSSIKKIFELLILIVMVILEYFNLLDISKTTMYLSLLLSIYILVSFIYEKLYKNEYISVLSVKKGIDASDTGIMFLDDNNIILINNLFSNILKGLNITKDFINNLIKSSFKKVNNNYLLKYNDKVYMLNIYDNKDKILLAIKNVEELEREKNLLKLKNEYHDIIGYRLALFDKYLEQENKDINNILKLLDSIYEDFNSKLDSNEKLKNLINMYSIIGINVKVFGALPIDEEKGIVFFEIIREAITNAIIHANSKNIKVVITAYDNYIEMVITNDGNKPKSVIFENEGIKGMRKKLSNINGSLKVITDNNFKLIIKA